MFVDCAVDPACTMSDAIKDVFSEASKTVGRNGVGATCADFDNDGDLDIYIINAANVGAFGEAVGPRIDDGNTPSMLSKGLVMVSIR